MGPAIKTFNLTKRFGNLVAVDHINIEIAQGEIFGLLGPNGAGKTTTIHMLATILKPTEGTALVGGYDVIRESKAVREKIGIVFQDVTVDRNLTGYENLWVYGKLYGLAGGVLKERIFDALKFMGLEKWKDVPVRKYSGGMIRRLEIARSLLNEPEILFLDEPTLGLDPHTRAYTWEFIRRIKKEKDVTILLTTHYLEEADALCDRIAIIDFGKIIAIGTPDELKWLPVLLIWVCSGVFDYLGYCQHGLLPRHLLTYRRVIGSYIDGHH
ncbi:MAG: ATP-binding cassette domain-containing protein [Crenarchaeota archaeon]|nr:ATP-binding cassette domain-containing protein [Thermoproteota archaeon]MCR8471072.1 ATP-binding cassette domain-containing protein [Thermoproteota archaeon]MCR8472293.1 ATP-binding cassette domain-containing protein [Thermoproteota archaeon]MCR8473455.1 ATP-binding cassette domain-containing protein [Thermoproteota archaeon]